MEIKPITRKEVAERANVSVAVVSYVVNDGSQTGLAGNKAQS